MKPYPRNNIDYKPIVPIYVDNTITKDYSRYSIYRIIDNLPNKAYEIKLNTLISTNNTYKGYYYTTTKNDTLYSIAKKYYNNESYYWIVAKANGLKDNNISVIKPNTTLVVPALSELQKKGGYFNAI